MHILDQADEACFEQTLWLISFRGICDKEKKVLQP
jgi:hypothetical protein